LHGDGDALCRPIIPRPFVWYGGGGEGNCRLIHDG